MPIIEDIDEWIIGIKDLDGESYQKYTGVSIKNLADNLMRLAESVEYIRGWGCLKLVKHFLIIRDKLY